MNYDALQIELAKPSYATMTDQEAADAINSLTVPETVTAFKSYRSLCAVLTDPELVAVQAAVDAAAAVSARVAVSKKMLELPGDEAGNGGGIDFGSAGVREWLDYSGLPAELIAKLKGLGERTSTVWETVTPDDVAMARGTRPKVQIEGVA